MKQLRYLALCLGAMVIMGVTSCNSCCSNNTNDETAVEAVDTKGCCNGEKENCKGDCQGDCKGECKGDCQGNCEKTISVEGKQQCGTECQKAETAKPAAKTVDAKATQSTQKVEVAK